MRLSMTDIVERLRNGHIRHQWLEEAADEIERLRKEIERHAAVCCGEARKYESAS
jgi:hypothetical protein